MEACGPSRRRFRRIGAALILALGACAAQDPQPSVRLPPVDDWPSPNPDLSLLERGQKVGRTLEREPPLLDELEFADGHREPGTVTAEGDGWIEVMREGPEGTTTQRIDRAELVAVRRPTSKEALERRLAHLVRVEAAVDAGRPLYASAAVAPVTPPATGDVPAGAPPPVRTGDTVRWELEDVRSLRALPGAAHVGWWPGEPMEDVSSATEPADLDFGRTGIWAMLAGGLGHDSGVGLEVTITAERVVFEHSPGYWGADMDELHGHWRLWVDGVQKWEYLADIYTDLPGGRFAYNTASVTLGPGTHVVRWELQGCDTDATYFWALDSIEWQQVTPPTGEPTWGAIAEP